MKIKEIIKILENDGWYYVHAREAIENFIIL